MSQKWWDAPQTTTGRGIWSQYNPNHIREWEERDRSQRTHARAMPRSPERSLRELRALQSIPAVPGHVTHEPRSTSAHVQQPPIQPVLPQYSHHHHLGWNPPSPERRLGGLTTSNKHHAVSYGLANGHNHKIHHTLSAISTRKP